MDDNVYVKFFLKCILFFCLIILLLNAPNITSFIYHLNHFGVDDVYQLLEFCISIQLTIFFFLLLLAGTFIVDYFKK